jgi:hypothetical protein
MRDYVDDEKMTLISKIFNIDTPEQIKLTDKMIGHSSPYKY